jgi:polyisoprenoid-binding protein YceI
VTTIHTGISLRDAHLRSRQFFDASRFPKMTFRSTRIEQIDSATWHVAGNLTIRDITKEVVLETVYEGQQPDAGGPRRAAFSASTVLSRREYGLGMGGGGVIVGDLARVSLQITALSANGTVG